MRSNILLAGAAALHLGLAGDLKLDGVLRRLRVAAGSLDQAGGRAFLVVQQRLQQMLGGDALVEFADGDGLRSLNEAARPVGKFFDIHGRCPLS